MSSNRKNTSSDRLQDRESAVSKLKMTRNIKIVHKEREQSWNPAEFSFEDDHISKTIEELYDSATWRMYHRIVNARNKKADLAAVSTVVKQSEARQNQDALSKSNGCKTHRGIESPDSSQIYPRKIIRKYFHLEEKERYQKEALIIDENLSNSQIDANSCRFSWKACDYEKDMMFTIDM